MTLEFEKQQHKLNQKQFKLNKEILTTLQFLADRIRELEKNQ